MIRKDELMRLEQSLGLPLVTLEKDYILSLLLWSFSQHPVLKDKWVFKGGTCLKKCYFGSYRFSEDLDFTLTHEASIDFDTVRSQLANCFARIFDSFAILINVEDIELIQFPDKIGLFIQIKIPYKGPLMPSGSLPRIKLDLSKEEILVRKPERLPLIHGYSDQANCDTDILCYSLYEIFAEKLRALIQRTRPRDLYDVIHLGNLFKKEELDIGIFNEVARQKFEHKGMKYPESLSQISDLAMSELEADWEIMLSHQVRDMETMSSYVTKYEDLRTWIVEPMRRAS